MPYEPIVPDGQHLGTSHNEDGAVTGHLFSDEGNKLQGHAAWRWVDEPEEDYSYGHEHEHEHEDEPPRALTPEEIEAIAALAVLIVKGVAWAVVEGTPRFKLWWNERAVPAAKSAWNRVTGPGSKKRSTPEATFSPVSRPQFVASSSGVELVVTESKISMSSAEWEQRFRAMLAAGAFKEEQSKILSRARIEDDGAALEREGATEQLTAQQLVGRVKLLLEANRSLLDDETSAELMRVFRVRVKPSSYPIGTELEQ